MGELSKLISGVNPVTLGLIIAGIILLIIVLSIVVPVMIKKMGIVSISKDGITLSNNQIKSIKKSTADEVHELQRRQIAFVNTYCKSIRNSVNIYIESQGYRYSDFNVPYTISMIKEEIITWILFEDISNSEEAYSVYLQKVWLIYKNSIWSSQRGKDYYKIHYLGQEIDRKDCTIDWYGDYFKLQCDHWLRNLIDILCKI